MKYSLTLLFALILSISFSFSYAKPEADQKKAVLITGATSGIGRATAELLASKGYLVYAGARKDADMAELNEIENITAVRLDVTDQEQIAAAVKSITASGYGLWGLVNNAGVNVVAPMIMAEEKDLEFVFQVNVYGVYRVTKAFAPLVLESKGRIINISSISGVLSGGGYGMYSASKHAVEAFTDSTHAELSDFGVHVAAVNPGNFGSEIGLSRCKRMVSDSDAKSWGKFEERRQQMLEACKTRIKEGVSGEAASPIAVAKTVKQALFEDNPRERYLVVPKQLEAGWTITKAVDELLKLNVGHEHSYTRDELAQLIDAMWPYAAGEEATRNPREDASMREFLQAWMTKTKQKQENNLNK